MLESLITSKTRIKLLLKFFINPLTKGYLRELAKEFDGKISSFYLTLGQYDIFIICEFPDDEKAARFTIKLGSLGNVRTTTLKAFTEEEYKSITGR